MNMQDLLGAVAQSGMRTRSSTDRFRSSVGGGGMLESIAGMFGGGSMPGSTQNTLGGLGGLGGILEQAGRAVGGNQNLALGGLGALAGALMGGRRGLGGAVRGGLGGGVMAILGAMAFQALQARAGQSPRVPLGLAAARTDGEQAELERNSELVLRAMINAAKADGRIDENEIRRILGRVQENGADQEAREFLRAEMEKPMETARLTAAARGHPELAAELYGASLLAIEVDTPAEQQYLQELAAALGLEAQVVERLHQGFGLRGG